MSDNEENSHPPVFGKKRKTATRPRKPAKTNAVGSAKLEGLFAPSVQVGSAAPSVESTEDPDTRYAIKDNLDSMELDSVSSQAQPLQSPTGTQSDKSMTDMPAAHGSQEQEIQEDQARGARTSASASASASTSADIDEKPHEYSNEARTYMARYDYLSELHDLGRHNECREGCLDLLTEPRIPLWTRVQTLQMVATLFQPALAQDCLQKAEILLTEEMDADMWQTRVLKSDNNKMFADLNVWRNKNGLGQDLDGTEWGDIGGEPVAEFFKFDRQVGYKADDERELDEQREANDDMEMEELDARTSELTVRTKPQATGAQLPSPTGSEE